MATAEMPVETIEEKKPRKKIDRATYGGIYETLEECKALPVADEDGSPIPAFRVYQVGKYDEDPNSDTAADDLQPKEVSGYVWARNYNEACGLYANHRDYYAVLAERRSGTGRPAKKRAPEPSLINFARTLKAMGDKKVFNEFMASMRETYGELADTYFGG